MSKYLPLTERLSRHAGDEWRASFAEIEDALGFPLPKSARGGAAWWSNAPDKPWMAAGWEVAEVDRPAEMVTFRRPVSEAELSGAPDVMRPQVQAAVAEAAKGPEVVAQVEPTNRPAPKWGLVAAGAALVAGLGALIALRRR
ncbi:DUF7662 domain-containing protein [Phenylobacterium soli]|uniref:DUF7662 domain-containing protein n=1 Tax=Phenylobacterium soli TaxID=2170551 RepID=A0A328ANZ0_9CAUL|nr:hypothetical protein [Phenylobacterium soli]RAK56031.1 hypothetical protein DJ017_16695 [Phenylobacterium soli]